MGAKRTGRTSGARAVWARPGRDWRTAVDLRAADCGAARLDWAVRDWRIARDRRTARDRHTARNCRATHESLCRERDAAPR